jgi:DNA (cytosine-5)-methyltransferase 1
MAIKILNLYAGVGGNRRLWKNVNVTSVEINKSIADIYKKFFPNDKIVIGDAHQFLLEHYQEYQFVWSSPPCPSHSICNHFLHAQGNVRYPDMSLWQEIVFLTKWFKGHWCVENVKSYYPPLYPPKEIDRHYFWSNFEIKDFEVRRDFNIANARATTRQDSKEDIVNLENFHNIKLPDGTKNKRLLLRNCVWPPLGLHILNCARKEEQRGRS